MTPPFSGTTFIVPAQMRPITVRSSFVVGSPLFKYVDSKDAHFLEKGSIKIGTLRGYAALEGARKDGLEHTIFRPGGRLLAANPAHRAYMEASDGLKFVKGGFESAVVNINLMTRGNDLNCVCFSITDQCKDIFGSDQALFRIDDPFVFVQRLSEINNLRTKHHIGHVDYKDRVAALTKNPTDTPDPFVKPTQFAEEQEVRVLWDKITHAEPETIFSKEDEQLARMLIRLR